MSKIWFSSDHHFFHNNVIKYCNRPFTSVEEMNEVLVQKWNAAVAPEDTVYYLGDFSLAFRPVELYTKRLNGKKILIAGNHDWCHRSNKKSNTPEKAQVVRSMYYREGWAEIHESITLELEKGLEVNICHMPYENDYPEEKFKKYRLQDSGKILLHGHVHTTFLTKRTNKGTLMINVGCDVWDFAPVNLETIIKLIKELQNV